MTETPTASLHCRACGHPIVLFAVGGIWEYAYDRGDHAKREPGSGASVRRRLVAVYCNKTCLKAYDSQGGPS